MLIVRYFSYAFLCLFCVAVSSAPVFIAEFSKQDRTGWDEKEFEGNTLYKLVSMDGQNVLAAKSDASASGLFKEVSIDLEKTPYINWRWKIDSELTGLNEKSKEGDDYVARIYVVSSGGLFVWNTRALNYVWSSNQTVGEAWPNAYTSNAYMVAVESGSASKGQWKTYKRNVLQDFKQFHDADISEIDVVAIMTDTDNSGQSAKAFYGDIYFSAE